MDSCAGRTGPRIICPACPPAHLLLFAIHYCLQSTTICNPLLFAIHYWNNMSSVPTCPPTIICNPLLLHYYYHLPTYYYLQSTPIAHLLFAIHYSCTTLVWLTTSSGSCGMVTQGPSNVTSSTSGPPTLPVSCPPVHLVDCHLLESSPAPSTTLYFAYNPAWVYALLLLTCYVPLPPCL